MSELDIKQRWRLHQLTLPDMHLLPDNELLAEAGQLSCDIHEASDDIAKLSEKLADVVFPFMVQIGSAIGVKPDETSLAEVRRGLHAMSVWFEVISVQSDKLMMAVAAKLKEIDDERWELADRMREIERNPVIGDELRRMRCSGELPYWDD